MQRGKRRVKEPIVEDCVGSRPTGKGEINKGTLQTKPTGERDQWDYSSKRRRRNWEQRILPAFKR